MTALGHKLARDLVRLKGQVFTIALVLAAGIMAMIMLRSTWASLVGARDAYYADYRFADVFAHLEREGGICDRQELYLEENAIGDVARILVRCKNCDAWAPMSKATRMPYNCNGERPWLGGRLRVEHWTSAAAQAAVVARAILGIDAPDTELPYFWSDQVGLRLQYVGHALQPARVEIDGDPQAFRANYLSRDGRLTAVLLANRTHEAAAARRELAADALPRAA